MGKRFAGDKFYSTKTEEQATQEISDLKEFGSEPEAIDLDHYFILKGYSDPARQAGMKAYTTLRRATLEKWNSVFSTF